MMSNNSNVKGKTGELVGISIKSADKTTLSPDVQEQIGDRPAIELNATYKGETVAYSNSSAPVTVSIPYTPSKEERENLNSIKAVYIDENGKLTVVPDSRYDFKTGMVTFTTTHFSTYAITYTASPKTIKTFKDLSGFDWAKTEIESLATMGIINGTGQDTFSPGENITRADFVTMLVRALKLKADGIDNFADVETTDYYYESLGIAKKLGIITGVGDNKFNPQKAITREDMMVITARALRFIQYKITPSTISELSSYSDCAEISGYAGDDVATLIKSGIIKGSGNNIFPHGNTTRAEVAVMIHRIINNK